MKWNTLSHIWMAVCTRDINAITLAVYIKYMYTLNHRNPKLSIHTRCGIVRRIELGIQFEREGFTCHSLHAIQLCELWSSDHLIQIVYVRCDCAYGENTLCIMYFCMAFYQIGTATESLTWIHSNVIFKLVIFKRCVHVIKYMYYSVQYTFNRAWNKPDFGRKTVVGDPGFG